MHLVCPACLSVNRIAEQRLADRPRCGRCNSEILDGQPLALTGAGFDRYIERNDLPVVVYFWAGWCGPCKNMAPVFTQLAAELSTRLRFAKVDVDAEPALTQRYGIRSIPTLVLFRQGREADRVAGALPAGSLREWLSSR